MNIPDKWWDKCDTLKETIELGSLFIALFNEGYKKGCDHCLNARRFDKDHFKDVLRELE